MKIEINVTYVLRIIEEQIRNTESKGRQQSCRMNIASVSFEKFGLFSNWIYAEFHNERVFAVTSLRSHFFELTK